jgi:type 1 fimbriae regulatory protein FimB
MNQNPTLNGLQVAANEVKHLTAEQLEEVMTAAMKASARDHALLLTIFQHGLRASEAAELKLSDINWPSMEITIRRKKGSLKTVQQLVSQRGKPALDEVKALRRWISERNRTNEPTSYVFASQKGGALHPDVVNRIFKKYVAVVNADRINRGAQPIAESACHVHALKHTLCTLAIDAGMDFYKVALRAGHAALSSTLKYTHGSGILADKAWQEKTFEIFG